MNGLIEFAYPNNSPRINAWAAHYVAKGCSASKARTLANKKVRIKRTWP